MIAKRKGNAVYTKDKNTRNYLYKEIEKINNIIKKI